MQRAIGSAGRLQLARWFRRGDYILEECLEGTDSTVARAAGSGCETGGVGQGHEGDSGETGGTRRAVESFRGLVGGGALQGRRGCQMAQGAGVGPEGGR